MTIFHLSKETLDVSNAQEARELLKWIQNGRGSFPPTQGGARELKLLTDLSISDMGTTHHHNDPKRAERSWGQNMRKRRTGTRRG